MTCHDCGTEVPDGLISKKFGVCLCRTCWETRTGWNLVLEAAKSDASNADVAALAEKARLASEV
jgi:hypothetical protein